MMSDSEEDMISQLPDDIRISIISRLPLRDAIATSVLSSSWRHLYTHADMQSLVFPACVFKQKHKGQELEVFSNYLNSIECMLDLYRHNHALKEFVLETLDCLKGGNLKRWVRFALARRVETLKIQLGDGEMPFLPYALRLNETIHDSSLPGLNSLKELSLCGVCVEDSEVQLLVPSFPLLESLSISNCKGMKNILVAGGLKLKKLSLRHVFRLESVEIRGMINLVSFECLVPYGYDLRISNVPKLTEFIIVELTTKIIPTMPSCIRDQLRLLTLNVDPTLETPVHDLKNVKNLELILFVRRGYYATHQLFPMIEACTSLETLVVEFALSNEPEVNEIDVVAPLVHEIDVVVPAPSKQWSPDLKKLVLPSYMGIKEEVEFAKFMINNVAALEEVSVTPCDDLSPKERHTAIEYAEKELRHESVNLLILH